MDELPVRKSSTSPKPSGAVNKDLKRVSISLGLIALQRLSDPEVRAQLDLFYAQVIALIGQAVRVGHALGFARDADVHVIAVAALAGL